MPAFAARARVDTAAGVLMGSRCPECETLSWPARAVCNRCGNQRLRMTSLPAIGRLLSYTRVWVPRPGLEPPYILGQVDLGHGARLFAHVRGLADGARVPMAVRLVVPAAGAESLDFWFAPS